MIVKVLYSIGDDVNSLYLCKIPSSKIQDTHFKIYKVHRPQSEKTQTFGVFDLKKCLNLAIQHSPELFHLDKTIVEESILEPSSTSSKDKSAAKRVRVVDYSVYHKDALEENLPLVGHGSLKELVSSNSSEDPGCVVGVVVKKPNFLVAGDSDEDEDNEPEEQNYSQEFVTEENSLTYLKSNSYHLEVRLQFKKYYRNFNSKYDTIEQEPNLDKNKKHPAIKASRTLSLPVFNPAQAYQMSQASSLESFYNQSSINLKNIKPTVVKKKKRPVMAATKKKKEKLAVTSATIEDGPPRSPKCVHCTVEKSSEWRWHKSDKKEGLICKECNDYYRKYFKFRSLDKAKSKKRKISGSTISASPLPKKYKAHQGSVSIAESLSVNRELLKQEKHYTPVQTPEDKSINDKWINQMLSKFGASSPVNDAFEFDDAAFDSLLNDTKKIGDTQEFEANLEKLFNLKQSDSDGDGSNAKTDSDVDYNKQQSSSVPSSPIDSISK